MHHNNYYQILDAPSKLAMPSDWQYYSRGRCTKGLPFLLTAYTIIKHNLSLTSWKVLVSHKTCSTVIVVYNYQQTELNSESGILTNRVVFAHCATVLGQISFANIVIVWTRQLWAKQRLLMRTELSRVVIMMASLPKNNKTHYYNSCGDKVKCTTS